MPKSYFARIFSVVLLVIAIVKNTIMAAIPIVMIQSAASMPMFAKSPTCDVRDSPLIASIIIHPDASPAAVALPLVASIAIRIWRAMYPGVAPTWLNIPISRLCTVIIFRTE